jgi:hypothetical protein
VQGKGHTNGVKCLIWWERGAGGGRRYVGSKLFDFVGEGSEAVVDDVSRLLGMPGAPEVDGHVV